MHGRDATFGACTHALAHFTLFCADDCADDCADERISRCGLLDETATRLTLSRYSLASEPNTARSTRLAFTY